MCALSDTRVVLDVGIDTLYLVVWIVGIDTLVVRDVGIDTLVVWDMVIYTLVMSAMIWWC